MMMKMTHRQCLAVPHAVHSLWFLLLVLTLVLPSSGEGGTMAPEAREVVRRGTVETGLLTGFWQATTLIGDAESANRSAVYFLPQIGMVLTDEFQAGFLTGNLELLVEPLLAHYYQPSSASAFGGSLVLKYNLLSFGRWMPYWDIGAGMIWTDLSDQISEQSTNFNFVLETGPGV